MRKSKKVVSELKDTAAKVVSKVEDVVEDVMEEVVEEVAELVEGKVEEVAEKVEEVIEEVKEKASGLIKVISIFRRMHHPDQKVRIEQHEPRELKKDSWIESQIKAGLLKEV